MGRRIGQQLEDGKRRHRLSGPGFADQRQRLALGAMSKRLAAHRVGRPCRCMAEFDLRRSSTVRRTVSLLFGVTRHVERLARVEGVAHRLADEDQQARASAKCTKSRQRPSHGACRLVLPWRQQFAQRRRTGRQAEAEKVERRQCGDRAVEDERHEGQRRDHGVRQRCRNMIVPYPDPQGRVPP